MTVSTIASIAAGIGRTLGNQNTKVATSVKSLVSGSKASVDVSSLSVASTLQSQISSLRSATQNVAQASALVRVAQGGVSEISRAFARLQELSARASGANSANERAALDIEFQSLRSTINRIASSTSFGSQKLLDGSLTSDSLQITAEGEDGFAIADLSADALIGDDASLLTADGAQQAFDKIRAAQTVVTEQQATLGALDEGLDFAFASIDTAAQNQEAARAVLSDADFAEVASESVQAKVQAQATSALLAQTSRLPNNVLALLTE